MASTTRSLSGSFGPMTTSEPGVRLGSAALTATTQPAAVLPFVVPGKVEEAVPDGYTSIDDIVDEYERDPAMREELRSARKWIADTVFAGKPLTLRTLRLRKGMSQAQLAEAIGTQQPHVARIESGQADLRLETCRRIAQVLGVDLNTLDVALLGERRR